MEIALGKSIENPILLNSVDNSILYLDSLITNTGNYIIYHRLGSSVVKGGKPIDRYEVFSTDFKKEILYISIYNDKNNFIPPIGYFFEAFSGLFFKNMIDETQYFIENMYWFSEDIQYDKLIKDFPLLNYIDGSFGDNLKHENFPLDLLAIKLKEEYLLEDDLIKEIIVKVNSDYLKQI
jgi:hypothetical protein